MSVRTIAILFAALLLAVTLALSAWTRLSHAQAELTRLQGAVTALEVALAAAKATEKAAVRKAKWREKAAAKAKRMATLVPLAGAGVAIWLEEREYREWRGENPDIPGEVEARKSYYKEVYTLMREALEEESVDWKRNHPVAWEKVSRSIDDWYRRVTEPATP